MDSQQLEANFNTLVVSIASSAVMAMGMAPDPRTEKTEKNLDLAQFNIELLLLLQKKTAGNLTSEEAPFLQTVISDLQMKFVQAKEG